MLSSSIERRIAGAVVLTALLLAACIDSCSKDPPPPPARVQPSIVLFTLDTTRADHLGCYGDAAARTPRLDELARTGVRFAAARTTCPLTLPAHSSMLTGLEPFRHGARDNAGFQLADGNRTLAEILGAAGYDTAAFVASVVLGRATGVAQGFATFEEPRRGIVPDRVPPSIRATEVNAGVRSWLARRDPTRPFFLWVHYYDAHAPYEPPPAFAAKAATPYDGEISAVDAAVGEILDALADVERAGRLLTMVVADHGEGLGFQGEPTHSVYVYDPLVHVPLLVRWPTNADAASVGMTGRVAGTIRTEPVSVVDVFSTALAAAGVPAPIAPDGLDLASIGDPKRPIYSESWHPWLNHGWSPLLALVDGDLKYVHSSQPELFVLTEKDCEEHDVAAQQPKEVARLARELEDFIADHLARGPAPEDGKVTIDAAMLANFAQLGYVDVDPGGIEWPDPFHLDRDRVRANRERYERYTRATTPGLLPTRAQAVEAMRQILADEPDEIAVLDNLGRVLVEMKQGKEAIGPLKRLVHLRPNHADGWGNLGASYQIAGEFDLAIDCYESTLRLDPTAPAALVNLAACLDHVGRKEEAAAIRLRIEAQKR